MSFIAAIASYGITDDPVDWEYSGSIGRRRVESDWGVNENLTSHFFFSLEEDDALTG